MTQIKPLPSQTTPRFADIATFFRLPVVKDLNKLDYCVCGIPWDGGTTNRPGARPVSYTHLTLPTIYSV